MAGIYIVIQEYDFIVKGTTNIASLLPGDVGLINPSDSTEYLFSGYAIPRSIVISNPTYFTPVQNQGFWAPPADGSTVYRITDSAVSEIIYDESDDDMVAAYAVGNITTTLEEANSRVQQNYLTQRLRELANGLNLGWLPNWNDADQLKYYISFRMGIPHILSTGLDLIPGVIYFRSEVVAQQALDLLGSLSRQLYDVWNVNSTTSNC